MERPTSIAIIGWLLAVSAVVVLLFAYPISTGLLQEADPPYLHPVYSLPFATLFPTLVVNAGVIGMCGFGLLNARGWGRFLTVGYCGVWTLINATVFLDDPLYALNVVSGLLFTVGFWYLFYRSRSAGYFRASQEFGAA